MANELSTETRNLLYAAIIGLVAGSGGSIGYNQWFAPNPRPDPFTGRDGRELEIQIEWLMSQSRDMHTSIAKLNGEVANLPPRALISDLADLKARVRTLEKLCDGLKKKYE